MLRVTVILAVLAVGVLSADPKPGKLKVEIVENVGNFLRSNPGFSATPLQKTFSKNARNGNLIRYTLGGRSKCEFTVYIIEPSYIWSPPDDRLVAEEEQQFRYPNLHDVSVQMTYPEKGQQGAEVTYVEILAEQSSDIGNAYVVSGGIGQRFISMIVEAKQTNFFEFTTKVYGY